MKKIPLLLLVLAVGPCVPAHAQSSWNAVQQLKPGTNLRIKTTHGKVSCAFVSADADSLTCGKGITVHLQKPEILAITVSHRGRSAAVGFGVGAGVGAAVGAGVGQNGQIVGRGGLAAIFAVPLAVIGAFAGFATDFTHSTIYRN